MRLIDADKIYQMLENKSSYGYLSALDISSIEIVEAIPVEWIKKWCNKEHNRKSLEERLLRRYGVITMLEDWEKENEKS